MVLYDFLYYNFIGLISAGVGFLSVELITDRENFINNLDSYKNNILYWSIDKFLSLKVLYDMNIAPLIKNKKEQKEECKNIVYCKKTFNLHPELHHKVRFLNNNDIIVKHLKNYSNDSFYIISNYIVGDKLYKKLDLNYTNQDNNAISEDNNVINQYKNNTIIPVKPFLGCELELNILFWSDNNTEYSNKYFNNEEENY